MTCFTYPVNHAPGVQNDPTEGVISSIYLQWENIQNENKTEIL